MYVYIKLYLCIGRIVIMELILTSRYLQFGKMHIFSFQWFHFSKSAKRNLVQSVFNIQRARYYIYVEIFC